MPGSDAARPLPEPPLTPPTWVQGLCLLVLALMAGAIGYTFWIAASNWSQIHV